MTIYDAIENNDIERVKELIPSMDQIVFDDAMWRAACLGHIDIVRLMIEKGADNFNHAMFNAAKGGHIDIVKLLIEKGANDFDWAIYWAACGGHIDVVQLLFQHLDNKEEWFRNFVSSGNYEIVSGLLSYVSDSVIHECIEIAREKQYYDIVSLLSSPVYRSIHDNFEETRR
jgi:ankyrin repeat protein